MSTDQQSKPRRAKKSIAEESGRPGTCRSKVGCAAIDEPCTNRIVPAVSFGSPAHFSNRNSFTPPSLVGPVVLSLDGGGGGHVFIVSLR